jgi:hypothetical protein
MTSYPETAGAALLREELEDWLVRRGLAGGAAWSAPEGAACLALRLGGSPGALHMREAGRPWPPAFAELREEFAAVVAAHRMHFEYDGPDTVCILADDE